MCWPEYDYEGGMLSSKLGSVGPLVFGLESCQQMNMERKEEKVHIDI